MAIVNKEDVLHEIDLGFFTRKAYVWLFYLFRHVYVFCVLHVVVELSEGTVHNPGRPSKGSF